MHWKEEHPHLALERRALRAARALAANDRLAQSSPREVQRPPRSSLLRPSSAQSTVTSVAEPTEHFPNQKARMRLEAYLSQSLQEMAGTGMLSDKANRVRARSLVVAEFRRMEDQYLTDQLPLGAEPRVRIAESSHASRVLARTAEQRPSSGRSSPSRETEARSGIAFAERLDTHAAAERRRKREAAAARRNARMPLERKGSAGRSRAGSAGRPEGQSLHFDVDEDSGKSVADQLRDALSKAAVRVIDLFRDWDDDGDGTVTRKEFHRGMADLGFNVPKAEIDALFTEWDPDGSGYLELRELGRRLRAGSAIKLDARLLGADALEARRAAEEAASRKLAEAEAAALAADMAPDPPEPDPEEEARVAAELAAVEAEKARLAEARRAAEATARAKAEEEARMAEAAAAARAEKARLEEARRAAGAEAEAEPAPAPAPAPALAPAPELDPEGAATATAAAAIATADDDADAIATAAATTDATTTTTTTLGAPPPSRRRPRLPRKTPPLGPEGAAPPEDGRAELLERLKQRVAAVEGALGPPIRTAHQRAARSAGRREEEGGLPTAELEAAERATGLSALLASGASAAEEAAVEAVAMKAVAAAPAVEMATMAAVEEAAARPQTSPPSKAGQDAATAGAADASQEEDGGSLGFFPRLDFELEQVAKLTLTRTRTLTLNLALALALALTLTLTSSRCS